MQRRRVSCLITGSVLGKDLAWCLWLWHAAGTIDQILPIITSGQGIGMLLGATSICAPILEEVVFRGFLMASLTKWMPVPASIALSSVAFSLLHAAPRDAIQLACVGGILGYSYARTRNLATPMVRRGTCYLERAWNEVWCIFYDEQVVHSLWNSGVVILLLALSRLGVDVETLLRGETADIINTVFELLGQQS